MKKFFRKHSKAAVALGILPVFVGAVIFCCCVKPAQASAAAPTCHYQAKAAASSHDCHADTSQPTKTCDCTHSLSPTQKAIQAFGQTFDFSFDTPALLNSGKSAFSASKDILVFNHQTFSQDSPPLYLQFSNLRL